MSQEQSHTVSGGAGTFRVALMGAPLDTGNRGVTALGCSLVRLISQARPDAAISLLIGSRNPGRTLVQAGQGFQAVETVNYRLSPRAALGQQLWWILLLSLLYRLAPSAAVRNRMARANAWVRSVSQADFAGDIRGGDSFSDIYGAKEFLLSCLPVLSVIWIRGGIHLLPQTYGPFRSRAARWMARHILLRAESVWCRDSVSVEEVARLTGTQRSGSLCPDVAFVLEGIPPESVSTDPPLRLEEGERLIGLNVSGLMYHGGYTRANMFGLRLDYRAFLKRLADQLLSDGSNRMLLVPHTFAPEGRVESDPVACRDLVRTLPTPLRDRVHVIDTEYDQHRIKAVIGMCDFFIGSRMHACIAALSQGIPTIGVAYSRKFSGVFDTLGAADWVIDGRSDCVEEALARALELFRARDAHRAALRMRAAAAQEELERIFERLLGARAPLEAQRR